MSFTTRLRASSTSRRAARKVALFTLCLGAACGGSSAPRPRDPLAALRDDARASADGETVGRWMLAEMVAPGGERAGVAKAKSRLSELSAKGMHASVARAIDDEAHGRFQAAAGAYLETLEAARSDASTDVELVGWFAASRLLGMRQGVQGLWKRAREAVARTIDYPGNIGWRARGELVEWWSVDGVREQLGKPGGEAADRPALLDQLARRYGCVTKARLAGPFGHGAPGDHRTHFDAERPGPWPVQFAKDPGRLDVPHVLKTEQRGCQVRAAEAVQAGLFYVETYLDLPVEREAIIAVQGALAVFVDDVEVLTRDTAEWGIWPRFGARVRLLAGRHRVLARVGVPETSIRMLASNGAPLAVPSSDDARAPYALTPPERLPDPNPLEPYLAALGVPSQAGTPRATTQPDFADPIGRYIAAYLAHIEGQDDVASVLLEPLVKEPSRATGISLASQAVYLEKDPVFPESDARDLAKDVRSRASSKDPELWWPRLWLALEEADRVGVPDVVPKVVELADRFREVPDVLKALATMYGRAGWKAEHARAVKEGSKRFPEDEDALLALLRLYDAQGRTKEADEVAERVRALDPDAEIDLERALERRDYSAAIAELKRLASLRKDRKDIAIRIADLLTRAGKSAESLQKLERAVEKSPNDGGARLALADARFARGDGSALRRALVDAIQTGADASGLRDAIELVEGMDELTPFRQDGRKIIADFEASGESMPGTAARVLDYSTIWIHADGSARMLEHEIICIQSREAIQELAEQKVPKGLILHLRTLKRDGTILEPELVEGKPTVTMPHLEVGDYIETENVTTLSGDGRGGRRFEGPRWFFREEKLAYWRSEFVAISPKARPLVVETGGAVPAPGVTEDGAIVTRRWRVDKSPAVPEEPGSAPIQEFLPNVRIGWGITLDDTLARLVDAAADETPRDPRLVRVAETIAKTAPSAGKDDAAKAPPAAASADERARRVYRWVLANVENGREDDGRRVVIGKSGNRTEAFRYLCRLLGIDAKLGFIHDRLTAPPIGPLSEAEQFDSIAVRIVTEKGPRWMTVRDKFAPYGYLPSSLRGQPAVVLAKGAPRETTAASGSRDGITNEGTATLAEDGSATLDVEQRYEGKFAIGLRTGLESLPDARLKQAIESRLLPQSLPGARLVSIQVKNLADLDAPLVLAMKIEMPNFARRRGNELVISPPFQIQLGSLASLPTRETPLYLSESISTRTAVKLAVKLPAGARVTTPFAPFHAADDGRVIDVTDHAAESTVWFERVIDIPAGRVQPPGYPAFEAFAREADAVAHRDVVVVLGGR